MVERLPREDVAWRFDPGREQWVLFGLSGTETGSMLRLPSEGKLNRLR